MSGFAAGLLHPLVMPAHIMAIMALALLIGRQRWGYGVVAVYILAVLAGLGAIAVAYAPTRAGEALLALAAIAGLLVALERSLPWMLGVLLAGAIGLALALDSPPEAISLAEANLTLAGTALSLTTALLLLTAGVRRLTRDWQHIGARILGSWIAASAILVLALHRAG